MWIITKKVATMIMTITTMSMTITSRIMSISAMIARRALEVDRTTAVGLITQSMPSMLLALSTPMTPTTPSSRMVHALFIKVPSIPLESAKA